MPFWSSVQMLTIRIILIHLSIFLTWLAKNLLRFGGGAQCRPRRLFCCNSLASITSLAYIMVRAPVGST
jgi:hypothetical protein